MTLKVDNKEYLSEGPDLVSANVDSERPTVRDKDRVDAFRRGWQQLIDYRLIEWGWSSDQLIGLLLRSLNGRRIRIASKQTVVDLRFIAHWNLLNHKEKGNGSYDGLYTNCDPS